MTNSNPSLHLYRLPRWLATAIMAVSILGFVDASYLAAEHFAGGIPNCYIFSGCAQVATSQYSSIAGIPIALLGALYYLVIFLLVSAYKEIKERVLLLYAAGFSSAGFLFSLWLIYLQLFVIDAICIYCMMSALSSTALFLLGLVAVKKTKLPA